MNDQITPPAGDAIDVMWGNFRRRQELREVEFERRRRRQFWKMILVPPTVAAIVAISTNVVVRLLLLWATGQ